MSRVRRRLVALLAALLLPAVGAAGWIVWRGAAQPQISEMAVASLFAARWRDPDGREQPLAQWRERPLLINFWATWCSPCRQELPSLLRLNSRFSARGVQFVGIAVDSAPNVVEFARNLSLSYPLLVAGADVGELMRQLGNSSLALPYTVVVDAAGRVRFTHPGRVSESELEILLTDLLAEN